MMSKKLFFIAALYSLPTLACCPPSASPKFKTKNTLDKTPEEFPGWVSPERLLEVQISKSRSHSRSPEAPYIPAIPKTQSSERPSAIPTRAHSIPKAQSSESSNSPE